MGQRLDRPQPHTQSSNTNTSTNTQNQTSITQNNHLASSISDLSATSAASSSSFHTNQRSLSNATTHDEQAAASESFLRFLQTRRNYANNTNSNNNNNNKNEQNFRLFNYKSPTNEYDSDVSTDDDTISSANFNPFTHALPLFMGMGFRELKCLVCNKSIRADDLEAHLTTCLMKPTKIYNDDVLTEDRDECIICLETLEKGQQIARLTCLCIYHKHCIDAWLKVNVSCPAHPPD